MEAVDECDLLCDLSSPYHPPPPSQSAPHFPNSSFSSPTFSPLSLPSSSFPPKKGKEREGKEEREERNIFLSPVCRDMLVSMSCSKTFFSSSFLVENLEAELASQVRYIHYYLYKL